MKNKLKFFLDTEFIEVDYKHPIYPLSIGIICENGQEFYIENIHAPIELANDWVKENVFPYLNWLNGIKNKHDPFTVYNPNLYAGYILKFITNNCNLDEVKPEFWGYFCDYDWVLFCQLFGTMSELPKRFPHYCNDLKQLMKFVGEDRSLDELVGEKSNHNALNDAKQIKKGYEIITSQYKIEVIDNLRGRI
jgi:hypothetical protein